MNRTRQQRLLERERERLAAIPIMQHPAPTHKRKMAYTRPASPRQAVGQSPRSARLKRLNSRDWGMPITACAAATRLPGVSIVGGGVALSPRLTTPMKRRTAPKDFLPRVAMLGPKLPVANKMPPPARAATPVRSNSPQRAYSPVCTPATMATTTNSTSFGTMPTARDCPYMQQQEQSSVGDGAISQSPPMTARFKLAKAFRLPDQHNKSFVYLCKPVKKVKELLTARQMRNSSEELRAKQTEEQTESQFQSQSEPGQQRDYGDEYADDAEEPHSSNSAAEEYTLAPLMEFHSSSASSVESYTNASSHPSSPSSPPIHLESLQRRQTELEELNAAPLSSYQGLLHSQLMDIRQREQLLQSALDLELNDQPSQEEPATTATATMVTAATTQSSGDTQSVVAAPLSAQQLAQRRLDLDQVFQNIPTLQREIKLLQQIGEKLEATLRLGGSSPRLSQSSSVYYTPRTTLANCYEPEPLPIIAFGCRRVEQQPLLRQFARVKSSRRCFGFIKEFRIETKTLTELKIADETQCFYLPGGGGVGGLQSSELRRTSFRKLKQNPNVLLQQLRPLSPTRPFNLLEQDAMFFNSVAYGEALREMPPSSSQNSSEQCLARELSGSQLSSCFASPQQQQQPYNRLMKPLISSTQSLAVPPSLPSSLPPSRPSSSFNNLAQVPPPCQLSYNWSVSEAAGRLFLPSFAACQCQSQVPCQFQPEPPAPPPPSVRSPNCSSSCSLLSLKRKSRPAIRRPKNKERLVAGGRAHSPQQMLKLAALHKGRLNTVTRKLPMADRDVAEQKLHLVKTVLVGLMQMAVFLVLIMAFTYPDARC